MDQPKNALNAQSSINIWAMLAAAVVTAVVAGGITYYFQKTTSETEKQQSNQNIQTLQQQISQLQTQISRLEEIKNVEKQEPVDEQSKSSFEADKQGNFYGTVIVTGYPIIKSVGEPFCNENCKKYSYVFFQITDTDSKVLSDFLVANKGNSFVGNQQVGLGCVQNKIITYFNDSNNLGMKEYSVSTELSKKILESNKEKPIVIKLEKLLFTGGGDAPACFSHFTYISSLE